MCKITCRKERETGNFRVKKCLPSSIETMCEGNAQRSARLKRLWRGRATTKGKKEGGGEEKRFVKVGQDPMTSKKQPRATSCQESMEFCVWKLKTPPGDFLQALVQKKKKKQECVCVHK